MIVHLVDLALLVLLLEAVFLVRAAGDRDRWLAWLATLGAGAALLLAVRLVAVGSSWPWVTGCMTLALIGHGIDLRVRLNGRRRPGAVATS